MKNIIALLLALIMVLSMAACSANDTAGDGNDTTEQTDLQMNVGDETSSEPDEEASTDDSTANGNEEEPSADSTTFDTAWASNEFEALLPQLPFSGWTTSQPDDKTYKMELIGLNTSPATNAPDSGEPDGADKQRLLDYFETLTAYGFTIEETGTDYLWEATDAAGNRIEFMCADGGCWITITKAE